MRTCFPLVVHAVACLATLLLGSRPCFAEDPIPGEASALTDEVRAQAQKQIELVLANGKEAPEAVRALLVLGPLVWPVVEIASKRDLAEPVRARFGLLKALLVKKKEPDFESLRGGLRRAFAAGADDKLYGELVAFRQGRPDPAKPGKALPLGVKPKDVSGVSVYRSADKTIVVAFGADGTSKTIDGGDVTLSEPEAGFVAAIGGKPMPAARKSGRGGNVDVQAPLGYAVGCSTDGAPGMSPGGAGGDGGTAQAKGAAGNFTRAGSGGAGGSR